MHKLANPLVLLMVIILFLCILLASRLASIAVIPLLGGVLVYFSPCFMEMFTVYISLISGIKVSELSDKKSSKGFRLRILGAAALFVAGFTLVYTAAGVVIGLGGEFLQQRSSTFDTLSLPLRLVGGSFFIYIGVQSSGILPRISWLKNSPLFPRVNQSCRTGGSFLVGLIFGSLQCFRGALVIGMLFLAFTLGSPVLGGFVMFLLAMAFGLPFIFIALLAGRTSFLSRFTPRTGQMFAVGVSAFMIFLGIVTILYGNHEIVTPVYSSLYYFLQHWIPHMIPSSPP